MNQQLNTFNITPRSLCEVNIMNYDADMQAIVTASLRNAANEPLLIVKSLPFLLKKGLNTPASINIGIASAVFSATPQGKHLQTSHALSSGRFHYCISVQPLISSDASGDDNCEEIESDLTSFLFLVNPSDKEIIESQNPVLIWSHSEPFNILASGEFYRLVLVALQAGQSAEAGVTANAPLFLKNNLRTHQVPYPFDAPKLEIGKRYGWQVQRVVNNVITEKSESWEFTLASEKPIPTIKYAVLKKELDGGYYTAEHNKIYFKYEEEYTGGTISCVIYDSKGEQVQAKARNESATSKTFDYKQSGYNGYEINLNDLDVSRGFYILKVNNDKQETLLLKFYIP